MELLPAALRAYLDGLVPERPAELQAMEADADARQFPIIGPACGHLCYLLARMTGARRVFELGSGFGYSTAFFARAVQENGGGVVHHVVWDEDLSREARRHLAVLGFEGIVQYHVREAIEALGETEGPFDLIFNDIHKEAYPASLPVIEAKLKPGGVLIVDNMLWSGLVFDPAEVSEATEGVRKLTRLVTASPQWTSTLVPIRDGLLVAFKKPS